GEATFQTQYFYGSSGCLYHDQQSLPGGDLRKYLCLADIGHARAHRLDCREAHPRGLSRMRATFRDRPYAREPMAMRLQGDDFRNEAPRDEDLRESQTRRGINYAVPNARQVLRRFRPYAKNVSFSTNAGLPSRDCPLDGASWHFAKCGCGRQFAGVVSRSTIRRTEADYGIAPRYRPECRILRRCSRSNDRRQLA